MRSRNPLRRALSSVRGRSAMRGLGSRLVWIMGSPRSGSTWLVNLLARDPHMVKIDEPLVAAHLGVRVDAVRVSVGSSFDSPQLSEQHADRPDYVFSSRYAAAWQPSLARMLLERFAAQARVDAPGIKRPYVLIKEPHGSEAAPLIFTVLPSARLLFLVRDARDVVDSVLDMTLAAHDGVVSAELRRSIVAEAARAWAVRMSAVAAVYDRLPDTQRLMLRYEDIRDDPVDDLLRVYAWLNIEPDVDQVRTVATNLSFERVPEESRGSGRFHRAATPGLWRENLTPAEQVIVGDTCASLLARYGYDS